MDRDMNVMYNKICIACGKKILVKGKDGMCLDCYEESLYKQVKEYVLSTGATAVEVADKFDLPLATVNKWIRDGRLEYKKSSL